MALSAGYVPGEHIVPVSSMLWSFFFSYFLFTYVLRLLQVMERYVVGGIGVAAGESASTYLVIGDTTPLMRCAHSLAGDLEQTERIMWAA